MHRTVWSAIGGAAAGAGCAYAAGIALNPPSYETVLAWMLGATLMGALVGAGLASAGVGRPRPRG